VYRNEDDEDDYTRGALLTTRGMILITIVLLQSKNISEGWANIYEHDSCVCKFHLDKECLQGLEKLKVGHVWHSTNYETIGEDNRFV